MKLTIGGTIFYMQKADQGPTVTVEFIRDNCVVATLENVGKGFKAKPEGGFDTVRFKAPADGNLVFVVSDGDVNFQYDTDRPIIGNDDTDAIPIRAVTGERLPVDIGGGTVTVTADNVGINNNDAAAVPVRNQALTVIVHNPAKVINTGAAQALVSDATLKRLRIANEHVSATVAIGGAGVTLANAAILLSPGDMWSEDDAAGAAWFAVSDTDGADVRVMGMK